MIHYSTLTVGAGKFRELLGWFTNAAQRRAAVLSTLFWFLLFFSHSLHANWFPNSTNIPDVEFASIAVDPQGNAVAIWANIEVGPPVFVVIESSTYSAISQTWTNPITVTTISANLGAVRGTSIGTDAAGNAVAVWFAQGVLQGGTLASPFNSNSWVLTSNIDTFTNLVANPSIGVDPAGNAVVAWVGTGNTIKSSTLPFGSTTWSSPVTLEGGLAPEVAVDPAGNAVVVYSTSTAVRAATMAFGTNTWTNFTTLASTSNTFPQVATDSAGNAVAVWAISSLGDTTINGSRMTFATMTWTPTTSLTLAGQAPKLDVNGSGLAVAIWYTQGLNEMDGAVLNPLSTTWQPTSTLATDITQDNRNVLNVKVDSEGNALAVFGSASGLLGPTIYSATLPNSSLTWSPPETIDSVGSTASDVSFVIADMNSAGEAAALWSLEVGVSGVSQANVNQLTNSENSTVIANPTTVVSDGVSSSIITVTLLDGNDRPVVGNIVSLQSNSLTSVITPISNVTNALGQASFAVTDTVGETVTYTALDETNTIPVTQTAQVLFSGASATASTVVANPTSVPADGQSTSTITVTLLTDTHIPLVNKTVTLSANSGSSIISPASAVTNNLGQAFFTVKDTIIETVTYTATDVTDSILLQQTAQVNFTPRPTDAGASFVFACPSTVLANGIDQSVITVILKNSQGQPVVGHTVTLSASGGSSSISPPSGISNVDGQVIFRVTDKFAETVIYTATDLTNQITIAQRVQVTFTNKLNANNFRAVVRSNKFASQVDVIHELFWDPTPGGDILGYRIYEGDHLIAQISANEHLKKSIHNRSKKKTYVYTLVTVTPLGKTSSATIIVWPEK